MGIGQTNHRKRWKLIVFAFLFLFSLLYSGVSHVYAQEVDALVNIEVQTKLTVSDGENKEQIPTIPFSFELTSEDPNAPLPQAKQVSINGEGKVNFSILFDKAGIFDYQIHQITQEEKDWTLDHKIYDVTVQVKADGQGNLIPAVVGNAQGSTEKAGNFVFNNHYTKKAEIPNPSISENLGKLNYKKSGTMPKTGDMTNSTLYAYIGLGILSVALLLLIYKRKRKETV
ncbi:hypothetical protein IGI96_003636 [Enterococcus sp. DIV0421]|uniref:Spy0128 family protein n=1 Tax=Enterococcus sp. DIV0421 TaxID=2774688 RepID=UPI003F28EA1E